MGGARSSAAHRGLLLPRLDLSYEQLVAGNKHWSRVTCLLLCGWSSYRSSDQEATNLQRLINVES